MKLSEIKRIIREAIEEQGTSVSPPHAGSTLGPSGVGGTSPGIALPFVTGNPNQQTLCLALQYMLENLQQDQKMWKMVKPHYKKAWGASGCDGSVSQVGHIDQEFQMEPQMYINPECTEEEIEAEADGCFSATGHFTDIDHDCPGCPQQE